MRGVSLLPKEFRRAQEHAGAKLPAKDVRPLIDQNGQVSIALNPAGEKVTDDGFRCRPDT